MERDSASSASQAPPLSLSGAEAVIESLITEQVAVIFGYPGGAIMPIYDALYLRQEEIRHVLVRHEQCAVHAAQGYARASGKVTVCFATSGPGATNLVTGLADALADSTPLVCITGQVASPLLGTDAFQETDILGLTTAVTKWNYLITDVSEIPEILAKAFYIARSGRPGPVLIDIAKDAQVAKHPYQYAPCHRVQGYQPMPKASAEQLAAAAALINQAERPMILAGQGIILSGAEEALQQLAEKSGIPVACTLLGLSCMPVGHPLYVGMLGMHGNYGPNIKTNECDLIIGIGMRFDDRVTGRVSDYATAAKIIHIDIDAAEHGKIIHPDVSLVADAHEAIQALLPLVQPRQHEAWRQSFREADLKEYQKVIDRSIHPQAGPLTMAEVVHQLSEISKGKALIVSDVGQHQMAAARYYAFQDSRSHITSGGIGTMGFAIPAALGAAMGAPHRQVCCIVGDGGFQMTMQELATIAQEEVPVKIILLNNGFLGMVRQWQELFFENRYSFTTMKNPDFVALGQAFGLKSWRIDNRESLPIALKHLMALPQAALLEVVVAQEENVFPMIASGKSVAEISLG
jgi:acetolactate synthase-1/2/3 large subunit